MHAKDEPHESMEIGEARLNILREWGIWSEDKSSRWNTLSAFRVKGSGHTSSLTQVVTLQSIHRAGTQVSRSLWSLCFTQAAFPSLHCRTQNLPTQDNFVRLTAINTARTRTPIAPAWPCNIEMMYYRELQMTPGTCIGSELRFPQHHFLYIPLFLN